MLSSVLRFGTTVLSVLVVMNAVPTLASQQPAPGSSLQSFLINYNVRKRSMFCYCTLLTDDPQFETYTTVAGQAMVAALPVNDYDLLHFNTLLVNQTQPPVSGVACHTAPACTAFTLSSTLLNGIITPGQQAPSLGPAYITAKYQYSPITFFDPYAFYYGCVVSDSNGAASAPVNCNITATGQNSAGSTIYKQVFQYKTTGALLQNMTLGYFDQGWQGLQVQTLFLSVTNNATTAALFDNLVATVYGPQNAAVLIDF